MIDALNHELIAWLGYLQRGSVLLQLAILLIKVILEKRSRLTRRLNSELMRSVSHLIAPGALIVLGAAMKGLQWPGGYLQYLALLWMIWRLVEPTKLLLQKRFPRLPVEALDRSLFRPVLLVFSVGQRALEVILQYSVIGIGVMGVAYYIGINGTALVAVAGGLSVGIGFGVKEIISNFISSLWLLFEGSVRPGEILMINGDPCTVRKLGLRATQLRQGRDGAELLIPNQNFFTQEAESYTAEEISRRDAVVVGAAYHHEPRRVIAILEAVAQQHDKVLAYPPPAAFTVDFADSSINYKLLFWVRNPLDAFAVGSDLRQAIWTAFDHNGIGIPFPQRQVYPMEWPPSKEETLRVGRSRPTLQAEESDSGGETP